MCNFFNILNLYADDLDVDKDINQSKFHTSGSGGTVSGDIYICIYLCIYTYVNIYIYVCICNFFNILNLYADDLNVNEDIQ
jgi:hypothetical protein